MAHFDSYLSKRFDCTNSLSCYFALHVMLNYIFMHIIIVLPLLYYPLTVDVRGKSNSNSKQYQQYCNEKSLLYYIISLSLGSKVPTSALSHDFGMLLYILPGNSKFPCIFGAYCSNTSSCHDMAW